MPYKQFLMNDKINKYIGVDLQPTEYHNTVKPDYYWDGKTIPLENGSVDFVLATEFLEHYFDTASILKEVNRVLKPGGILFFTVPSIWPLHEVPYDYHRFTPFGLTEHFKNAAYSHWDIKPLGGFNYHFALSLALRYEKVSESKRKYVKPFVNYVIKLLIRKDNKKIEFKNELLYSGLYGFVTK
jgi:SAM-dependent methyltransferase